MLSLFDKIKTDKLTLIFSNFNSIHFYLLLSHAKLNINIHIHVYIYNIYIIHGDLLQEM